MHFGGEKGKCHCELFYKNKETVVSKDGGRWLRARSFHSWLTSLTSEQQVGERERLFRERGLKGWTLQPSEEMPQVGVTPPAASLEAKVPCIGRRSHHDWLRAGHFEPFENEFLNGFAQREACTASERSEFPIKRGMQAYAEPTKQSSCRKCSPNPPFPLQAPRLLPTWRFWISFHRNSCV